tara:strand:+ start:37371 stop:38153 length:783 start_codon:yes stop_codon:yes gene_type:complete
VLQFVIILKIKRQTGGRNMSIKNIVHSCVNGVSKGNFVCTTATYLDIDSDTRKPIIERTSVSANNDANSLILFGDNASGKSLICNLIEGIVAKEYTARSMSIKNRTSSGVGRAFIFGDEGQQSTGETSIRAVKKALGGAEKEEEPSLIILDEPDLGLSSKYSRAMGRYIAQHIDALKEKGVYLILVSHSAPLIKAFIDESKDAPSTLGLNTDKAIEEWLDDDTEKSVDDLLSLSKIAMRKEMGIDKAFDAARKAKRDNKV